MWRRIVFGVVQLNAPWLEQFARKPGTVLQPQGHPINSTNSLATPDCVMALKMQPLWITHTPAHISIRFGVSSIPFGFEISWRGCYLGAMLKKKKKLHNLSYAYGKKNHCALINCTWRWNISLWKWPPFAVWFWFAGCGIKFHLTGFMFLPSFVHSLTKHLLSTNCSQAQC